MSSSNVASLDIDYIMLTLYTLLIIFFGFVLYRVNKN